MNLGHLSRREYGPDLRKPGALGGTRTPNLLIRSQMLYPLSYERWCPDSLRHLVPRLCTAGHPQASTAPEALLIHG